MTFIVSFFLFTSGINNITKSTQRTIQTRSNSKEKPISGKYTKLKCLKNFSDNFETDFMEVPGNTDTTILSNIIRANTAVARLPVACWKSE